MTGRRLALLVLALLVVLAGCTGGGQRVETSGSPATVADDALAEAGYEQTASRNTTFEATVEGSISGDVELNGRAQVTAHTPIRVYRPANGSGAVAVVSAPGARPISNRPIDKDPFATLSSAKRVNYAQSVYEVENLEKTGERTVTMLGNETTLSTYEGSTADGTTVTVAIASVEDGEDFVTVVAVWRADAEAPPLSRLLAGLRHG